MKFKRVLATGDWHSGHQVGLSGPKYHGPTTEDHKYLKLALIRKGVWDWWEWALKPYRPINILLLNGDAIDGKGEKSGGTELIVSDRNAQCRIAMDVIEFIDPSVIRMSYGTNYHVGVGEDWEDVLAEMAGAKIGSHEWFEINGKVFDMKHKIGGSQIPHGRLTPLAKEILWNRQWSANLLQPRANVVLRSHTHYYEQCDHDHCLGFNLPAMMGFGSKFGARQCSGMVDIGFTIFDVYDNGEIKWKTERADLEVMAASAEVL
jgi:hypothetical protein